MDELAGVVWVIIPIVAIVGGLSYAAFNKWQDGEEKRQAIQVATGSDELHRRIQRIEGDIAALRMELTDTVKDVDERLLRIEILLREVE